MTPTADMCSDGLEMAQQRTEFRLDRRIPPISANQRVFLEPFGLFGTVPIRWEVGPASRAMMTSQRFIRSVA
jgi:hypothetical protein